MSKAYRFEIQLLIPVVIEDDSNIPMSKKESRQHLIENLREYIQNADASDAVVSDGVEL